MSTKIKQFFSSDKKLSKGIFTAILVLVFSMVFVDPVFADFIRVDGIAGWSYGNGYGYGIGYGTQDGSYKTDDTYSDFNTNGWGYGYGDFSVPTVTSVSSSATTQGATLNGSTTSTGSEFAVASARGFYYGTSASYGSVFTTFGEYAVGAFSGTVSNLSCETTYHYQAFATNSAGTGTGSDATFTTGTCGGGGGGSSSSSSSGGGSSGGTTSTIVGTTSTVATSFCPVGLVCTPNVISSFCPAGFVCTPNVISGPNTLTPYYNASPNAAFLRNLTIGSKGEDVRALQIYLNTHGFIIALTGPGSPGSETSMFGSLTKKALAKFQKSKKISPAIGYFGPITRLYVQTHP